jgi:hypothetical protein
MQLRLIFILFICTLLHSPVMSGNNIDQKSLFSESQRDKAAGGLHYPGTKKITPEKTKPGKFQRNWWPDSELTFLKYVIYILVLWLLVYLIYRLVLIISKPVNTKITTEVSVREFKKSEPELNDELDQLYTRAISEKDIRQMIRYSYLICLRELFRRKIIVFSKEKTNYEYLREIGNHPSRIHFINITFIFEKVWYGELPANENELNYYNHNFSSFRQLFESRNQTQ